eukprot:1986189-Pleurochrysis_carterae.AAC.1
MLTTYKSDGQCVRAYSVCERNPAAAAAAAAPTRSPPERTTTRCPQEESREERRADSVLELSAGIRFCVSKVHRAASFSQYCSASPKRVAVCGRIACCIPSASYYTCLLRMRILFLDVDGVVCCNYDALVEQAKLLLVLRIIEQTGAYVVLSSDWRRDGAAKYCIETEMRKLGIECIGSTPEREPDKWHRPLEIMDWMLANGRHVTHWVAIDDRMLEKEEGGAAMIGHCVLTEFHTGLTPELVKVAVKILGGPLPAAELRERNEARKRKTKVATNGRIVASLGKEHLFAPPAFAGRYVRDRIPLTAAEYRAAVASVNSQIRWLCCLCPWFVSLKDARERCKQLNQKYADRDVRFMLSAQDKDREYLLVPTLAGDPIPSLIVKQIEPPDAPLPLLKI